MITRVNAFIKQVFYLFIKGFNVGGKLFFATIFAQLISFSAYPIIARIYEVEMFAVYSLFISVVTVISCFATAKYSWAILLPDDEESINGLVFLSIAVAALCSAVIVCLILLFYFNNKFSLANISFASLLPFLFLFPFYPFIYGVQEVHRSLMVIRKKIAELSQFVVFSAILTVLLQILLAYIFPEGNGLIVGVFLSGLLSVFYAFWQYKKYQLLSFRSLSKKIVRKIAKKYIEFPLITTPIMLSNYFFFLLTLSLVASNYGTFILGMFSMAYKLIQLPFSLVEKSMSDILCRKISHRLNTNNRDVLRIYVLVVVGLLVVSLIAIMAIYYLSPVVIPILLGDKWLEVVNMVRSIIFPLALTIIVINMVMLFPMVHKKQYLFLPFKLMLDSILPILLFFFASENIYDTLSSFAIISSLFSIVLIVVIYFWLLRIYKI